MKGGSVTVLSGREFQIEIALLAKVSRFFVGKKGSEIRSACAFLVAIRGGLRR
jgi:hypothetical protein